MPHSAPFFWATGRSAGSYESDVRRGIQSAATSGWARSAATAACVIEIGQPCPASTCDHA